MEVANCRMRTEERERESENRKTFLHPANFCVAGLSAIFLVKFPFDSRHFASYSFSAFRGGNPFKDRIVHTYFSQF